MSRSCTSHERRGDLAARSGRSSIWPGMSRGSAYNCQGQPPFALFAACRPGGNCPLRMLFTWLAGYRLSYHRSFTSAVISAVALVSLVIGSSLASPSSRKGGDCPRLSTTGWNEAMHRLLRLHDTINLSEAFGFTQCRATKRCELSNTDPNRVRGWEPTRGTYWWLSLGASGRAS